MKRSVTVPALFAVATMLAGCMPMGHGATGPRSPDPDQGMTSQLHGEKVGQFVFAKQSIEKGAEDPSSFVTAFALGEPIYGRFYLKRSIQNEYNANGWSYPTGTQEMQFNFTVTVDGKQVAQRESKVDPKWTTYKFAFTRADGDVEAWDESRWFLDEVAPKLEPGKHEIGLKVTAYHYPEGETQPLAAGSFTIDVGADRDSKIASAKQREDAQGKAEQAALQADSKAKRDAGFVWVGLRTIGGCTGVSWKWRDPSTSQEGYTDKGGWMKPGTEIRRCVGDACKTEYRVTKEPDQQVDGHCE